MKLQGTIRRALALLLVFIFAMSNMGLAEVAEQAGQIIEEAAVEAPAIETPADDATEAEVDEQPIPDAEVVEEDIAETESGGVRL